jgi:transglutaminase-like putative cysteine protease
LRLSGKLLYLGCFAALAVVAALGAARVGRPSIVVLLVWAALAATLAGAAGLIDRRAWPAALVLLPAGAYLLMRAQAPLPAGAHGLGGQYGFYLAQLRTGAHDYAERTFPFQLAGAGQLKLLLTLAVYGATGLASFAALSLRRPLPAIVVFLAMLGFSLTVDGAGSVIVLPLAFLFLAGCLLALSRSLDRGRGAPTGVAAGAGVAVLAALLALLLLGATPVAASKPWQDWSAWGPLGHSPSHLTFDWMLNFPSLLNPKTNTQVMRVESPIASYWRANALETFTGDAWRSSDSRGRPATDGETGLGSSYDIPAGGRAPAGTRVAETFKVQSLYTSFLFTGGAPSVVVLGGHEPLTVSGARALRLPRPEGPRFTYALTAVIPHLKPADLVGRGRDYPVDVLPDLTLPFAGAAGAFTSQAQWRAAMNDSPADREWLGLYQLDQKIVGKATDPYQITLRIEQYLRSRYTYSLALPPTRYASPYAAFLFDTTVGYCQHFAGAMAALVRFNGIPARVAVGFTTGALVARNTFAVSRNNAHAWVEVYFPGVGWVPFDPTPGDNLPGAGPSSTNAGFVDPYPHDAGAGAPAAAGTAPPKLQKLPDPGAGRASGAAASAAASSGLPRWLPWALGLAVALLAWPFARGAARRRGLRGGTPDRRLRAALALIYAELGDYGIDVPRSQTLEETSGLLREQLDLDAASLTARLDAVLFGGRAADERDLADLARLRADLRRRLRARKGWPSALLAGYGLRVAAR